MTPNKKHKVTEVSPQQNRQKARTDVMKKMMYTILTTLMIFSFMGAMETNVSAKNTVNRIYNIDTKVKGKTTSKRKIIVKVGKKTFEKTQKKKGSYSVSLKQLKLSDKVGNKVTVIFQKKKDKKWKKVKTKTLYIIAKDVQLNDIKADTKIIKGYTIPEYKIKLTMDGKEYNTTASKKKGYFKIKTGKNIKDYDYTLKITKKNGKAYKTFTHEAGTTAAEVVFEKNKKPTLKKTEVKKTYTYKEDGESYKEKKLDAYKLSWTNIGGADGYDIDIYYPAEKKWERIDTVIKNSYKMTNLYVTKYQFRVRAFKRVNGKKEYGAASNTLTISPKSILWEGNAEDDSKYKERLFTQKIFDENTFVYQNEIRKKAGVDELVWSNVCYAIAVARAEETHYYFIKNGKSGIHEAKDGTIKRILEKDYKVKYADYEWKCFGRYDNEGVFWLEKQESAWAENWVSTGGKEGIDCLVDSPLHYVQMVASDNKVGAISAYNKGGTNGFGSTSAIYCELEDLDQRVANDSK